MSRKFDLYRIVKMGMRVMKKINIPLYWSKYSSRNHQRVPLLLQPDSQHIMLIVLAQYVGNVERLLQMLRAMDKARKRMRLKKIPHKSTISREMKRIPEQWIRKVLKGIVKIVGIPMRFAVDSTGIQLSYRSYYYTVRSRRGRKDKRMSEIACCSGY